MEHNKATSKVLEIYAETTDPQFALLVEAPWGAGKAHFVKAALHE